MRNILQNSKLRKIFFENAKKNILNNFSYVKIKIMKFLHHEKREKLVILE